MKACSLRNKCSQHTYGASEDFLPDCNRENAYCGDGWALPKSGDRHAQEGGEGLPGGICNCKESAIGVAVLDWAGVGAWYPLHSQPYPA